MLESECGNSVGAIALRLGLMSIDQVEQVADLQAAGENALIRRAESPDRSDR